MLAAFLAVTALTGLALPAILLLISNLTVRLVAVYGLFLLWVNAWFELNADVLRARLLPVWFGCVTVTKAAIAIGLGGTLAHLGYGAWGPLIGLAMANLIPSAFLAHWLWKDVSLWRVDYDLVRQLLRYGLPLTAGFAFSFIVRGSDRLMLGWLASSSEVGTYAAGYDIAQNSLEVLMAIAAAAAFPLAVNALDNGGIESARQQLTQNIALLLAVALPAAAGLALVAPSLSHVLLGGLFQADAARLIPWVALGVLLSGLRAYYFDHAFQLGKNTIAQVYVLATAAAVNIALNFAWIPHLRVMGAVYASVVAYLIGLVFGVILGRRSFPLPFPLKEASKSAAATVGMTLTIWPLRSLEGAGALTLQIVAGVLAYSALFILFNGLQARHKLCARFHSN